MIQWLEQGVRTPGYIFLVNQHIVQWLEKKDEGAGWIGVGTPGVFSWHQAGVQSSG